jgi:hypothetical protein
MSFIRCGNEAALIPTTKCAAGTECFFSKLSKEGVVSGDGPSSNVRATALVSSIPFVITGIKKPRPGKNGAIKQASRKITSGIVASQKDTNAMPVAIRTAVMPAKAAGEVVFRSVFPTTVLYIPAHTFGKRFLH